MVDDPLDMDGLDTHGFDTWLANPNARKGDLVLMYRRAPYSDIANVFVAASDPYRTEKRLPTRGGIGIDLANGQRLQRVIPREALTAEPSLRHWGFTRNPQGQMRHKRDLNALGVWRPLRKLIERYSPGTALHYGPTWSRLAAARPVFLSFSTEDLPRVRALYGALAKEGLEVWLDRVELQYGDDLDSTISGQLAASRAVVVCTSHAWNGNARYAKRELAMILKIAEKRRHYIFPVRLQNCPRSDALSGLLWADLFGRNKDEALRKIARTIRLKTGG
ncbi:toll/interleukin-1 receptor domain-containing protein [Dongia sedimenti]|uniref:Toll/interleukin-1 receptor domain-containing protein n=1 Tax=Dongia sedimenti TaxID=3064282 RepID=A0ABU0YU85_9PROT|nr:toll/interleukin-1 receptor domain-containing protein [Rhodospirillaceae bacterium R-7]